MAYGNLDGREILYWSISWSERRFCIKADVSSERRSDRLSVAAAVNEIIQGNGILWINYQRDNIRVALLLRLNREGWIRISDRRDCVSKLPTFQHKHIL